MKKEEIESKLREVFENILFGDGQNHTIRIELNDKTVFNGFRILENNESYILGLTEEQRKKQIKDLNFYLATVIPKKNIKKLDCPELW